MPLTLCEKVIAAHALDADEKGIFRRVRVDAVLGHDATIALLADEFERRKLSIWDTERVIFTNDHFSPPANAERADISHRFLQFSRQQKVKHLLVDKGICHQLLVEHPLCQPGSLIVGADSHTIMAGGLGACATGMGSTDILYALATGTTWLRTPESIRVRFTGRLSDDCSGRDVVLELLRLLGEDGANSFSLEFVDEASVKLGQDERFAIANMAVEIGAKFGTFVPDEVTAEYLSKRDGRPPESWVVPDAGARYAKTVEVNLSNLSPRVAKPYSPANVVGVEELSEIPITTAFLGSCSSGRLSDIRIAAEELAGKQVHPNVRFVVIPASVSIFKRALKEGYVEALTEAGALFSSSSCGPCGGIDKGILGKSDVCVSTSNRNFRGRMGHWDSQTYLASARTVARAAMRGALSPGLYP
jgi:3-isopropylmalate/(R)-2-methylmalate dehydratase large subunit